MIQKILAFFQKHPVVKHLTLAALAFIGFILLVIVFLRIVTHHGEAIVLPDYTNQYLEEIQGDAEDRSFELVVIDSIFVLDKKGGFVLSQNPLPGERVKRNRKVYLTVTKNKADEILSGRLPILYGKSYERKSRELKQGFEIFTKILDYRFDPGPPDYILAVVYEGDTIVSATERKTDVMIEKGATLGFILSKSTGGSVEVPNLVCKTYSEALFLCKSLRIVMADEDPMAEGESKMEGFITEQYPTFFPGATMQMGDTLRVQWDARKPGFCE
jgi:beta-lactam-binding protein with PASTA domain